MTLTHDEHEAKFQNLTAFLELQTDLMTMKLQRYSEQIELMYAR